MQTKRLCALLLTAALTLALAVPCAGASYYSDGEHYDAAFADMPVAGIDADGVDAFCERFLRDPAGEYGALLELFDDLQTQVSLLGIQSDCQAGDEARSAAYEQAQNDYDYAADRISAALSEALGGEQGDALRALMPEDEADGFADYVPLSAEELAADAGETALIQEYFLLPYDDDFETAAAELYLKLVALRRAQAEDAGFDSYPEYAYVSTYAREYVPEDARHLQRVVKSYYAPLLTRCALALAACGEAWDDDAVPSENEVLDQLEAHLSDVSPELSEAMSFLRRNHLCRIGDDAEMAEMAYTVSLPAYRSAFLFNKAGTRFDAFETTVHEFGHFNAAYHDPTPALYQYNNIDVSEVQSQGLEMLFLPCLQDILAGQDEAKRSVVALRMLTNMLTSVVDGCLYDEFEQAVYDDPALTVEELHQLEARLSAEYGYDELYEPEIFWPYVNHLFSSPCYYISYAVSALSALELWALSQEDYGAAVDAYMNISAARTDEWFFDVLEENGLSDVTNRRALVRLADDLERGVDALESELPASTAGQTLLVLALVVCVLAAALCVLLAVYFRRRRRDAAERAPMEF